MLKLGAIAPVHLHDNVLEILERYIKDGYSTLYDVPVLKLLELVRSHYSNYNERITNFYSFFIEEIKISTEQDIRNFWEHQALRSFIELHIAFNEEYQLMRFGIKRQGGQSDV